MNSIDGVSKDKNTHGVKEYDSNKSMPEEKFEELIRNGFTILNNIFDHKDCDLAKEKIDHIYEKQIKECGNEDYLHSIMDHNVARALFTYDDFFLKFIKEKNINKILKVSFGDKYILNLQNAPINRAKDAHYGSTWHRDLSYQHFVPSRPISLTVLVCLDEFTKENGGTCILPFSHKFEKFTSEEYTKKNEVKIVAKKGDVLIIDSLLFHRAGENKSEQDRKLLVQVFTLPFIKQQLNYPKILKGKYMNDQDIAYILGYDSEVEESVIDWRKRRKKRFESKELKS